MNEKRFEDDGVEYNNNYNYALLDTYYEFDDERIIEWNKHSDNAQYTDFERITEILNIKQMRLESLMKHREEIGKLFDRIDEQQVIIEQLKKEYKIAIDEMVTDYKKLEKENEQLREKVKDYEVILSIANSNDVLCEYQEIDDIAYYCERYKDYRCYPLCRKDKSCFKKDKTFQGKLEDLKEFWGERWYE